MSQRTEIKAALYEIKQLGDDKLDEVTLTIIQALLERARFQGCTDLELTGYLNYRKSQATRMKDIPQRERIVRIKQAITNNRWGVANVIIELRQKYFDESYRQKEARAARESFGFIPTVGKGGGSKSGRRRKKPHKRYRPMDPEADLRLVRKHNERMREKSQ